MQRYYGKSVCAQKNGKFLNSSNDILHSPPHAFGIYIFYTYEAANPTMQQCVRRQQQQCRTVKDYVELMSIVNLLANCIRAQLSVYCECMRQDIPSYIFYFIFFLRFLCLQRKMKYLEREKNAWTSSLGLDIPISNKTKN